MAIESSAENTYIKEMLNTFEGDNYFYIGATDKTTPDTWQWQYSSDEVQIVFGTGQGDAFALVDPPTEADDPISWYENWADVFFTAYHPCR